MQLRGFALLLIVPSLTLAAACGNADRDTRVRTAVEAAIATAPDRVREFYAAREGRPAWVDNDDISKARDAADVVRSARLHGLNPAAYGEKDLTDRIAAFEGSGEPQDQALADLDVAVTSALLALGHDVAVGRTRPERIDASWKARREPPELVASLAEAASGEVSRWLDAVRPKHPEYAALQQALAQLHGQVEKGGWPSVSPKSDESLRRRLDASGQLKSGDTRQGVQAFQHLHGGLKPTGVLDAPTLTAMNVPIEQRIQQVALNLERWRWMPDDLGQRHLMVNIPYFHLIAREDGKAVMDIRVVVGAVDNKTPIFSSDMGTVVFSPYWNIPESIVAGETAPAVARDPAYLSRNDIEVLRVTKEGTKPVKASEVNWDDEKELQQLAFRQRPGPGNALGHVKFLFPNPYDVYLHDTPADSLFARPGRALSHGCVRVEEPETLAKYVLRGYEEWDEPKIVQAMAAGVEKHVKLDKKIPVHLVYFTAWVDENGGLHFQPDIYGYDRIQSKMDR